METKDFNLVEEPWILVLDLTGKTRELSLLACFSQAHELYSLAGEMASQDAAVLRVAIGVLYAVFGRQNLEGEYGLPQNKKEAHARWKALWDKGRFPMGLLEDYLRNEEIFDSFYLFHPQKPFMQAAISPDATVAVDGRPMRLGPWEKSVKTLIGDLSESENKAAWFSYRTDKEQISFSEAARWLIHLNSFDVSPLGAPPRGLFRPKGFKLPWPNSLGLVWAQGDNLFETLMLNLVLAPAGMDVWEEFTPSWERETPVGPKDILKVEAAFPPDPCALFTYPFRYLQLLREGERVSGCKLFGGVRIDENSGNPLTETMTMWRLNKEGRHAPKKHDPAKQVWREFSSLIAGSQANPPGVVAWLSDLKADGSLNKSNLRLTIGGVELSSKSTSVDDAYSDSLRFQSAILSSLQEGIVSRVNGEIALIEKLARQAAYLASDLVRASGGSDDRAIASAKSKAEEEVYFLLDAPFRQWLEGIDNEEEIDAFCRQWRDTEAKIIRAYGQELVKRAGTRALVGRSMKERPKDKNEKIYASPLLYQRFLSHIRKLLEG